MRNLKAVVAVAGLLLALAGTARAEVRQTYLSLGQGSDGIIYEPTALGPKSKIAFVNLHSFSSYLGHSACMNLAERGYPILCGSTRFSNAHDAYVGYEEHAPAIKAAVDAMRKRPGVQKVVLIGHSMGAPMMAFYQSIAVNGAAECKKPERLLPCDDKNLAGLPAGDGLILLDPHWGDGFATLTYVDPAVTDDAAPARRDARLDMFAPANGFDTKTNIGTYSEAFTKTYFAAQAERHAKLLASAQKLLAATKAKDGRLIYPDDMPFVAVGANAARLLQADPRIVHQTKRAHLLLKGDGSKPTELLHSVRPSSARASEATTHQGADILTSVRGFLGTHAVRTTAGFAMTADDVTGVDWDSSNTSSITMVKGVNVPLLVMVMTGHYFLRSGEMILDAAASTDKELVGVEGATHGLTPCRNCADPVATYGDTVKRLYDYIDAWVAPRFGG